MVKLKKSGFNLLVFVIIVIFFVSLILWFFTKFIEPTIVGPYSANITNTTNNYIVNATYDIQKQYNISSAKLIKYCEKDLVTGKDICRYEIVDLTPMQLPKETLAGHFVMSLEPFIPVLLFLVIAIYLFGKKL